MRAMVLKGPGTLALEQREPLRPSPGEVLVRVTHSGVCGTDLKIYSGAIPVHHPLIMGHEMIGEVVEGSNDVHSRRGERVIIDPALACGDCFCCRSGRENLCPSGKLLGRDADGGFAEYVAAPRANVYLLPAEVSSRTAALIQVLTTCLHAQRLVNISADESVVVMGLGVTGQIHMQLAKAAGANPVVGVTRSAWKRELAAQIGASVTLPLGSEGQRGVLEATGGRGADVVIETTGSIAAIAEAITMARLGARLLLFGITTATKAALPFYQLYFKELNIINARAAKPEDFPASIDMVRRGAVRLDPLVSHVLPFTQLDAAIGMLESDAERRMKIILEHT